MDLSEVGLFLLDIDGVFLAGKQRPRLVSGRRLLPGLRARSLPYRLVTNTSTDGREALVAGLRAHGIEVGPDEIHSALDATVAAAAARFEGGRCFIVGEPGLATAAAAAGLRVVAEPPADVVLVGLSRQADYGLLSRAARCLLGGASLLGCHRNRMWLDDDGRALSCGPWLAALEFATGAKAEIFGKPSRAFYDAAREPLGVTADRTLMVGDDLEADVDGAQRAGMRAALVLTGKTSREALAQAGSTPDLVLGEVDDLVGLLPSG